MRPFLKWPGGKYRLLKDLRENFPESLSDRKQYVEPFLGGGAVFLDVLENQDFKEYLVGDINPRLITTYNTIASNPYKLMTLLEEWNKEYSAQSDDERKNKYYERREVFNSYPKNKVLTSALFLYLNKTCFNGLYRENSKGGFNAPFGGYKKPQFYNREDFLKFSKFRDNKNISIREGGFLQLENSISNSAFVYLDPPYVPINNAGYTTYKIDAFNKDTQIELRDFCDRLDRRGVLWLLSNSDPKNTDPDDDFLEKLYQRYNIKRISAQRSISAKSGSRIKVNELLISNY